MLLIGGGFTALVKVRNSVISVATALHSSFSNRRYVSK